MLDYLPPEVLVIIFLSLSVKALGQCMCVCRSWLHLIRSPSFISAHINRTSTRNFDRLILITQQSETGYKYKYSLLIDNDETLVEYKKLVFPYRNCPYRKQDFRIIGSCNGLICLFRERFLEWSEVILWNPIVDRCVTLPSLPGNFTKNGQQKHVLGFGFDKRNEYKVVRITYTKENGEQIYRAPPEVKLYSLGSKSWRVVDGTDTATLHQINHDCGLPVFVSGAVHWLAYSSTNDNLILSFDMSSEVFHELMLPTHAARWSSWKMSIAKFGESISFLQYGSNRCDIWVMKEYGIEHSWNKHYVVDFEAVQFGAIFGLRNNGEILMSTNSKFVSYHPQLNQVKDMEINGTPFLFCTESLALLTGVERANLDMEVNSKPSLFYPQGLLPLMKRQRRNSRSLNPTIKNSEGGLEE